MENEENDPKSLFDKLSGTDPQEETGSETETKSPEDLIAEREAPKPEEPIEEPAKAEPVTEVPAPKTKSKPKAEEKKPDLPPVTMESASREIGALFRTFEFTAGIGVKLAGGQMDAAVIDSDIRNQAVNELAAILVADQKRIGVERILVIFTCAQCAVSLGVNAFQNVKESRAGVETTYDRKKKLEAEVNAGNMPKKKSGSTTPPPPQTKTAPQSAPEFEPQFATLEYELSMWNFETDQDGFYINRPAKKNRQKADQGKPSLIPQEERYIMPRKSTFQMVESNTPASQILKQLRKEQENGN